MKKYTQLFILFLFLFSGWQASAQLDITADILKLREEIANVSISIQPVSIVALEGTAEFGSRNILTPELRASQSGYAVGGALRFFLFGGPRQVFDPAIKKSDWYTNLECRMMRNCGCYNFGGEKMSNLLQGLYIAPGIQYSSYDFKAQSIEFEDIRFAHTIKSKGAKLSLGYLIRISNFTIGAAYKLLVEQPELVGASDEFIEVFNNTVDASGLRMQNSVELSIGINLF